MASDFISTTVSDLAACPLSGTQRRNFLKGASERVLRQPALVSQLVARICSSAGGEQEDLDSLVVLLGSALTEARLAVEGAKSSGESVVSAALEALALAQAQGALGSQSRQHLIRAWLASGLEAPKILAFDSGSIEATLREDASLADALEDTFSQFERDSQGDPLLMHDIFRHLFAGISNDEERYALVRAVLTRSNEIYEDMACFWLLDNSLVLQNAAYDGLVDRLDRGQLLQRTYLKLVLLRPWLERTGLRTGLDKIIAQGLRNGLGGARKNPWTITSAVSSLVDGAGAQSIAIFLSSGKKRAVAMLLLKQGHGVKDAYVIPCQSPKEQDGLRAELFSELEPYEVDASYCADALSFGLGDGIAHSMPPAPGVIEFALSCGFETVRPLELTAREYLEGLNVGQEVTGYRIQQRGRLINKSKNWPLAYPIVETWLEDGDGVRSLLEKVEPQGMTASKSAIWDWLETRREYWAIAFARNAAILESAQNPDASSFAATAFALLDKRDLKKIPVMETILDQTISAWLYDAEDYAEDPENADNLFDIDLIEPETPGELDHLLKESSLSASWVVGYVSSAYIAPNRPDINDMLTDLLTRIIHEKAAEVA
jgi:hypothetical protein